MELCYKSAIKNGDRLAMLSLGKHHFAMRHYRKSKKYYKMTINNDC